MVQRSRRLRWERDMRALCFDLDDAAGTARHALQACAQTWGTCG